MDTEELLKALRKSTERCVAGSASVAVAYSGGLDSAMVEALARERSKTVAYTCAVAGSHDHSRASLSAAESGVDFRLITLDGERVTDLVRTACSVLNSHDPLRAAYTVPILGSIQECGEEVVLAGSGADELFGGYAKYQTDERPEESMVSDQGKMLSEVEALRAHAVSMGKRFEVPFASPELISFSGRLALDRKIRDGDRKVILREAAKEMGLISHDLPKKAAQYSSGVMREMKRMARERGLGLREWTVKIASEESRIP